MCVRACLCVLWNCLLNLNIGSDLELGSLGIKGMCVCVCVRLCVLWNCLLNLNIGSDLELGSLGIKVMCVCVRACVRAVELFIRTGSITETRRRFSRESESTGSPSSKCSPSM